MAKEDEVKACIRLLVAKPMLYKESEGDFKKQEIKERLGLAELKQSMKYTMVSKVVEARSPILPIAFERY